MIKEWFTAQELSTFKLSDTPQTERAFQIKAKKEAWRSRPREGRGGGNDVPPIISTKIRLVV